MTQVNYKQINWLASYPKSGNTWLRSFLDAYFLGECDINQIVTSVSDDIAARHAIGDGQSLRNLPVDVAQLTRPMANLRLVTEYNRSVGEVDVPLFVKSHNGNYVANGIQLLTEQLTNSAVVIVRDPRDVAVSFAKHLGIEIDEMIYKMCERYFTLDANGIKMSDTIGSWHGYYQSFFGKNGELINARIFRFEDMRMYPLRTFKAILVHMGVKPSDDRIEMALAEVDLSKLQQQEKQNGFKEASKKNPDGFFGKGKVGGWRDILTLAQANRIRQLGGNFMKAFEYGK